MKKNNLIPVDKAIALIARGMPRLAAETVPLAAADGRILGADIPANLSHPPAAVSAMDGYAARAEDVKTLPAGLRVIGESAAGHPFTGGAIGAGECVRIFTGAHCPANADTIILQEDTARDGDSVIIRAASPPQKYIRPAGNDFSKGEILAEAGMRLSPRRLALIGAAGHGEVAVCKKPRIAIISTGDELMEPGQTPAPHRIISSNGIFLERLVAALGGEAMQLGIVGDDDAALDAALAKAARTDLITTSGGASVGDHDRIARKMEREGETEFTAIAMRPGKPVIFGRLDTAPEGGAARSATPLLGLPGNPVSTCVCGVIFLAAAIRAMTGGDPAPQYRAAVLTAPLAANDSRQAYLRCALEYGGDGRLMATAHKGQDSGMLRGFADADGLIMRPVNAAAVAAGEPVPVIILPDWV